MEINLFSTVSKPRKSKTCLIFENTNTKNTDPNKYDDDDNDDDDISVWFDDDDTHDGSHNLDASNICCFLLGSELRHVSFLVPPLASAFLLSPSEIIFIL